jgi:hypothetical protein
LDVWWSGDKLVTSWGAYGFTTAKWGRDNKKGGDMTYKEQFPPLDCTQPALTVAMQCQHPRRTKLPIKELPEVSNSLSTVVIT